MGRKPALEIEPNTVGRSVRPRSPAELIEPTRGPNRPKGRRMARNHGGGSIVRLSSGVLTAAFLLLAGFGALGVYQVHRYQQPGPLQETKLVAIPKGEGRIQIARRLEREGVIANRWSFLISHLVRGGIKGRRTSELKAGEYRFEPAASMSHVLDVITTGRSVQHALTIPEGLTSLQIVERINAAGNLSGEVTDIPPEGSLLPDTYKLTKGTDRNEIIKRMRDDQSRFLETAWVNRAPDLPFATKQDAIILASIVEKETGLNGERKRVAAVFINRLNKGMRLQSDPTIIYGLVGGRGSLGRPIYRSEIKKKTPYNTYRIDGLPPTPIANPGRAAIAAVLNPANSKDLYFVADGTGGHKFSQTLKEHNRAVSQWREIEKQRKQQRAENTRTVSVPVPSGETALDSDLPTVNVTTTRAVTIPVVPSTLNTASKTVASESGAQQPAKEPVSIVSSPSQDSIGGIPLPERKPRQ